jgi:upstream activation factor subunit UAF30
MADATKPKRTPNAAFLKPMTLTPELQAVVGAGPMPRTEVVKALWAYIKSNNLQNPSNKREILPDATLGKVLGNDPINMFAMTKVVSQHLS